MKKEQLIKGNIYYADYHNSATAVYILRMTDNIRQIRNYLYSGAANGKVDSMYISSPGDFDSCKFFRDATPAEIAHLEACEAAGTFVPAPVLAIDLPLFN